MKLIIYPLLALSLTGCAVHDHHYVAAPAPRQDVIVVHDTPHYPRHYKTAPVVVHHAPPRHHKPAPPPHPRHHKPAPPKSYKPAPAKGRKPAPPKSYKPAPAKGRKPDPKRPAPARNR